MNERKTRWQFLAGAVGLLGVGKLKAQTTYTPAVFFRDSTGATKYLKPTGGIIADLAKGLLRTAMNAGLRGVPGYVWTVNNNGDGQNARIEGLEVVPDPKSTGGLLLRVKPQTPPLTQIEVCGVIALPTQTTVVQTAEGPTTLVSEYRIQTDKVPVASTVKVYRNGLRQSPLTVTWGTSPVVSYQPDYILDPTDTTVLRPNATIPNTALWNYDDLVIVDFKYMG